MVAEEQNEDYESGLATIGTEVWRIRTGRVTPTKPGAFLAVWTRDASGRTIPFADDAAVAGLLVFVAVDGQCGLFRFTREHLWALGISSDGQQRGKRGFRVYPSWCIDLNRQAVVTQRAQAPAFEILDTVA